MSRLFLWLALFLFHVPLAHGQQVLFDVKSPFEVKYPVRVIKHGVLQAIQGSTWAGVAEFGETYSLWITSIERRVEGDSVHARMTYELRTPAALTRGQQVAQGWNAFSYAFSEAQQYDSPELAASVLSANGTAAFLLNRASAYMMPDAGLVSHHFFGLLAQGVTNEFNQAPQAWEMYEATVFGGMVMTDLATYLGVAP